MSAIYLVNKDYYFKLILDWDKVQYCYPSCLPFILMTSAKYLIRPKVAKW